MQEVVEKGAMDQHQTDATRLVDVLSVTLAGLVVYTDDLTGEALSTQDVRHARTPDRVINSDGRLRQVPITLVSKGIKAYNGADPFAATPPFESPKYILRRAARHP